MLQIFVIVAGTLFLPIALETYARKNGKLSPGHTRECPASYHQPLPDDPEQLEVRCAVHLLGLWIDTGNSLSMTTRCEPALTCATFAASFSLFVYSASVAVQAITVISMGGIADNRSSNVFYSCRSLRMLTLTPAQPSHDTAS